MLPKFVPPVETANRTTVLLGLIMACARAEIPPRARQIRARANDTFFTGSPSLTCFEQLTIRENALTVFSRENLRWPGSAGRCRRTCSTHLRARKPSARHAD